MSIARTPRRIVRASKVHASKRFAQSQKVRRRLTGVGKVGRHSEDNHEHAADNCVSYGGSLGPRLSSRARKTGGNGNALDLDSERKDESERNAEQENSCASRREAVSSQVNSTVAASMGGRDLRVRLSATPPKRQNQKRTPRSLTRCVYPHRIHHHLALLPEPEQEPGSDERADNSERVQGRKEGDLTEDEADGPDQGERKAADEAVHRGAQKD